MSLWAIVPVKPLRRGKSRLSGVLSEEERTLLNFTMLGNTLKALTSVKSIQNVLVISRDPAALSLARDLGAHTVQEDGNSELNLALQRATVVAKIGGADSILIVPADIPLISPEKIQAMVEKMKKAPEVIIIPDRRHEGTNALLINPCGLIQYIFGTGSFQKHIEQAEKQHARIEVVDDPSIGLDLDLPEDLELLKQIELTRAKPEA